MDYYQTRRLLCRNDCFYVSLPKRFLRILQWRAGDDLLIRKNEEGGLCIRGKKRGINAVSTRGLMPCEPEDSPANSYKK